MYTASSPAPGTTTEQMYFPESSPVQQSQESLAFPAVTGTATSTTTGTGASTVFDLMSQQAANLRASFPEKLHSMMADSETLDFQHIVSWQDSGRSFKVHKAQLFQNEIIPKYFKPIKYTSFQRQLSIYGFQRIRTGWNTGGYEHPYFLKDKADLCKHIKRHHKPTAFMAPTQQEPTTLTTLKEEPAFSPSMFDLNNDNMNLNDMLLGSTPGRNNNSPIGFEGDHHSTQVDLDILDHFDFAPIPVVAASNTDLSTPNTSFMTAAGMPEKKSSFQDLLALEDDDCFLEKLHSCFQDEIKGPQMTPISNPCDIIASPKLESNTAAAASKHNSNSNNNNNKGAFFPAKLHQLLEDADRMNFRHIVSWTNDGQAFQIHDQKEFVNKIMNIYFDQSKFASFRRQLNLYGFNRTRTNTNRNMYFHEYFVQGNPQLCEKMYRRCSSGTAVKTTSSTVFQS